MGLSFYEKKLRPCASPRIQKRALNLADLCRDAPQVSKQVLPPEPGRAGSSRAMERFRMGPIWSGCVGVAVRDAYGREMNVEGH